KDKDNIFGLIEGYDTDKEKLIFTVLEESDIGEIEEGDLVVSSNLGGLFPDGLPIGEIEEIVTEKYGLTRKAYVKLSADLFDVNKVIVVNHNLDNAKDND